MLLVFPFPLDENPKCLQTLSNVPCVKITSRWKPMLWANNYQVESSLRQPRSREVFRAAAQPANMPRSSRKGVPAQVPTVKVSGSQVHWLTIYWVRMNYWGLLHLIGSLAIQELIFQRKKYDLCGMKRAGKVINIDFIGHIYKMLPFTYKIQKKNAAYQGMFVRLCLFVCCFVHFIH